LCQTRNITYVAETSSFFAGLPFVLLASCGENVEKRKEVAAEVNIVKAGQMTVPVYTEYVGQTFGQSDVDIHSRVDGWVVSMHFKEGDQVKKGQLLYVVDDLSIREKVEASRARLAQAKTMMVKAKSDLGRYDQEYDIRHVQVIAARKALELTEARYNYGYSSYYEVLIQQNFLFDAELAESTTLQQKINSIVFLYKSLGGGW
jgi:multidrug efflux pump subunit AcrA (membrane-fusion protein)